MELEDFEPTNEFEFDLSDVDVAAFESVATEDTTTNANNQAVSEDTHSKEPQQPQEPHINKEQQTIQEPQIQEQPQTQSQPQQEQEQQIHHEQRKPERPTQDDQNKHDQQPTIEQQIQQQQQVTGQLNSNAAGPKILLIPINTTSVPGVKHLLQLPAGSSQITVCTTNNKKQVVQLAQPSVNSNKHVLTKTTSSIQNNNTTVNSKFSTANLSTSRNVSYNNDSLGPITPNSLNANEVPKRKPCNCTKSQCLKLYCDCFANGEFCSGCNCTNCFNCLSKEKERQKAINQCLERNPEAFRPKIGKAVKAAVGEPAPDSVERRHTKGCNCKRSGCLKNYCECYEAKILCSNLCKCCGCKNYEESFERRSLMQITNATTDKTRGILKNLVPAISNSNTGSEPKNCFITDKYIQNALTNLLQSVQKAERDGTTPNNITTLIHKEMGKHLRTIVESEKPKANGNAKR